MGADDNNTITHELHTAQGAAQEPTEQQQASQQSHEESLKHSYEDLVRRDRELHKREVAFKEGQRAIKELAELRQRAKDDPFGVTRDLGIDTLALGDAILGEDRQLEQDNSAVYAQKIQELEQWKQQQELRYARGEQKRIIRRILRTDEGTDYGILSNLHVDYGDQIEEEVLALAEDAYKRTGESQDYRKIIARLEEQKEKEYYALTTRLGSINKIKEKGGVDEQPANLPREDRVNQGKPAPLTLSNDMSNQPAQETRRPLTQADRRRLFLESDFFKK